MMRIHYIEDPNDKAWVEFLSQYCNMATIFHHPAWLETLAGTYRYRPFVISVMDGGSIVTGMPFMEVRLPFSGKKWMALPYTDYCWPLGSSDGWNCLIQELNEVIQARSVSSIEVRWEMPSGYRYQTQDNVLHLLNLISDYSTPRHDFHRMHRKNIRRAERSNVEILTGDGLDYLRSFYQMHIQTRKRHGVPVQPWRFFENLHRYIISRGLGWIMLARHNTEWIAGGIFLQYGKTLTFKYTASYEDRLNLRPNSLIYDRAIQYGYEHGYSTVDLGKSAVDQTGLRDYKKRWGAAEIPLRYSYFCAVRPEKRNLQGKFSPLLKTILQNSPALFTRLFGELFYGYFP